ncbi:hypothetical protein SAMN05444158_2378 [Bradyrhizobium canariense]|uniref:Selenocysteine lyase/Cysteine desulfurase n=1 Tax=Bradyrhizobium canariense TaxID=255045 RepID=A0A1H1T2J8_9BRAD|nr:hypothetical protein SAMN05444158_2378 [Bradyrhizobium canariense]
MERAALDLQLFEQLLTSGGDERIAVDPSTGRNRYGTPPGKACDEVWFASSTATAISPRGYEAALEAYRSVIHSDDACSIPAWFDRIRARLLRLFGTSGSEVILSSSGTELEIIALFLARSILGGPLTNLIVGPGETGRGVLLGASGRHFLGSAPFVERVARGYLIEGFDIPESTTETVEIRDGCGLALSADTVDHEVVEKVETNIANNRCVLIHLLDCSKTNRSGLRRSTASALMARYGSRVLVVVDSCQLRCSPEQIRADLRAGFMVMITGSKFAAGPPFSGAILLPPKIREQLRCLDMPPGLLAYTAADDWPFALRREIRREFAVTDNFGAGLRWEAALAELEKLFALPVQFRESVIRVFANAIERHVLGNPRLELIDHGAADGFHSARTIFSIVTLAQDGASLAPDAVYRALRAPLRDSSLPKAFERVFHVGQPVSIGNRDALRICLSAPQIVDVAERMAKEQMFEAAVAPLLADLTSLFSKWQHVTDDLCRRS